MIAFIVKIIMPKKYVPTSIIAHDMVDSSFVYTICANIAFISMFMRVAVAGRSREMLIRGIANAMRGRNNSAYLLKR